MILNIFSLWIKDLRVLHLIENIVKSQCLEFICSNWSYRQGTLSQSIKRSRNPPYLHCWWQGWYSTTIIYTMQRNSALSIIIVHTKYLISDQHISSGFCFSSFHFEFRFVILYIWSYIDFFSTWVFPVYIDIILSL